ncbi:MAG: MTH1187 family thiamine-binding protein [Desulfobacterales bacterium]|nr:MTH1187 family thiamine-binding protein [Desulfobacterales bacterium]
MSAIIHFTIIPLDKGESLSPYVARVVHIVKNSGLPYRIGPMGTDIEGDYAETMTVVTRCFEELQKDCGRISMSIKVDYRKDRSDRMQSKVTSVGGPA